MTEENEKKKAYLNGYRACQRTIARLQLQLEEVRLNKLLPSARPGDGMAHGSGQSDLSAYAASVDKIEREILSERCKRIKEHQEICQAIEKMTDEDEKDLLFYRYIQGKSFCWIAEQMGYSYRNTTRLHGRALNHFEIPETCPTMSYGSVV